MMAEPTLQCGPQSSPPRGLRVGTAQCQGLQGVVAYLIWLRGSSFFSRALSILDSLLSSPITSQLLSFDCSAPTLTARAMKTTSTAEVWQGDDILVSGNTEVNCFSPLQTNFKVTESMTGHFLICDCKKEK